MPLTALLVAGLTPSGSDRFTPLLSAWPRDLCPPVHAPFRSVPPSESGGDRLCPAAWTQTGTANCLGICPASLPSRRPDFGRRLRKISTAGKNSVRPDRGKFPQTPGRIPKPNEGEWMVVCLRLFTPAITPSVLLAGPTPSRDL